MMEFLMQRQTGSIGRKRKILSPADFMTEKGYRFLTNMPGHFACVNAMSLSKDVGQRLLASGGDDRRVLLWATAGAPGSPPIAAFSGHEANIFCTEFSADGKYIVSGGNDFKVLLHDVESERGAPARPWAEGGGGGGGGACGGPFLTASDDGSVRLWDARAGRRAQLAALRAATPFTAVQAHPFLRHLFLTGNSGSGVRLWDLRVVASARGGEGVEGSDSDSSTGTPCLLRYDLSGVPRTGAAAAAAAAGRGEGDRHGAAGGAADAGVCGVDFNRAGTLAVVSTRHHCPAVLPVGGPAVGGGGGGGGSPFQCDAAAAAATPLAHLRHPSFRNATTLKSCSFAGGGGGGGGEWVAGGSDDHGIYLWRLPAALGKSPGPAGLVPYRGGATVAGGGRLAEPCALRMGEGGKPYLTALPGGGGGGGGSGNPKDEEEDKGGTEDGGGRVRFRRPRDRDHRARLAFSTTTPAAAARRRRRGREEEEEEEAAAAAPTELCASAVLRGHRSIPNHVVWHEPSGMMFSCGVEKIIKVWSFHEIHRESIPLFQSSSHEWAPRGGWAAEAAARRALTRASARRRLLAHLEVGGEDGVEADPAASTVLESERTIALFDYLSREDHQHEEDAEDGGRLSAPSSTDDDDSDDSSGDENDDHASDNDEQIGANGEGKSEEEGGQGTEGGNNDVAASTRLGQWQPSNTVATKKGQFEEEEKINNNDSGKVCDTSNHHQNNGSVVEEEEKQGGRHSVSPASSHHHQQLATSTTAAPQQRVVLRGIGHPCVLTFVPASSTATTYDDAA